MGSLQLAVNSRQYLEIEPLCEIILTTENTKYGTESTEAILSVLHNLKWLIASEQK